MINYKMEFEINISGKIKLSECSFVENDIYQTVMVKGLVSSPLEGENVEFGVLFPYLTLTVYSPKNP